MMLPAPPPRRIARTVPMWVFVAVVALGATGLSVPYTLWSLADVSSPVRELIEPAAFDSANRPRETWPAGAWVYIWRYLEVTRPLPCIARRTLVSNASVTRLPDIWEPIQLAHTGETALNTATVQIPETIAPGAYTYRVELECPLNPLKTVRTQLKDVVIYVATNPTLDKVEAVEKKVKALDKYVKPDKSTSTITRPGTVKEKR